MTKKNIRGDIIAKRTYCRPLNAEYTKRESWHDVVQRVVNHSYKLWDDAGGTPNTNELNLLGNILSARDIALVAGRTLWLGGTELAYRRPCCQFNCAFTNIDTIADLTDAFWLLLNGAGVGFNPRNEGKNYIRAIDPTVELEINYSMRAGDYRGRENTWLDVTNGVYLISVGDSADAWVNALKKLLYVPDFPHIHTVVLDFSECRGAGQALAGYGWQCIGSRPFADAMERIFHILQGFIPSKNNLMEDMWYVDDRVNPIQILDIMNTLGEVLSTRRSAQIAILDATNEYISHFIEAKSPENLRLRPWRMQSNNSVIFNSAPETKLLEKIKETIRSCGTEPGIINGVTAKAKAPWFAGLNPCAEILLPDKGFCNLVEINLAAFWDGSKFDLRLAEDVVYVMARHNYRQTCVNLRDGVLQSEWHENNKRLRLCGVSLTGFGEYMPTPYELRRLKRMATHGAYSMALELGTELPANITTIKPSGTVSKVMGTSEGIHTPMGQYVFNWVVFNRDDPLVTVLAGANYTVMDHPTLPNTKLICLPEEFKSPNLTPSEHGFSYDDESIEAQFDRYLTVESNWCDQNISNTMYYKPDELDHLFDLIDFHWDQYVAFSFAPRQDLSMSSEEMKKLYNAPYLPQELVSKDVYYGYVDQLVDIDVFAIDDADQELTDTVECSGGACPVR